MNPHPSTIIHPETPVVVMSAQTKEVIEERCRQIDLRAPKRQPRNDEMEITSIPTDIEGTELEVVIFFEMVFDAKTKRQIGYQLNEEDGSSNLIVNPH